MGRMQTHPTRYPTDLSDEEWEYIQTLVPTPKSGKGKRGRPIKLDRRDLVNAIFYEVRSGCAWRLLPKDFGPWQTVYGYYRQWSQDWTWRFITTRCATVCANPRAERLRRAQRSLTANRSRSPNKQENAATTRARRCRDPSVTWRWTAWD